MSSGIWKVLGIDPTLDKKEIRQVYSALIKKYHVEEHPEEFAKIQKAYHAALEYAKSQNAVTVEEAENHFTITESVMPSQSVKTEEKSLLSQLEEIQVQQEINYNEEAVIIQIIEMLINPHKAGDAQEWQEFFLSDSFLAVHDQTYFVECLITEMERYDRKKLLTLTCLNPVFLKELALVYGIITFQDMNYIHNYNQETMAELLMSQENHDWTITQGDAQLINRSYSFYFLRKLCQLAEQGGLQEYQQKQWGNLTFYAEDEFIPDIPIDKASKWEDRLELTIEPHAHTCVAMHRYLVKHYRISEYICNRMRDNFEIDGRMGGYPLCSYEPAYEQMCLKYPKMKESEAVKLTDWKIELLSGVSNFERRELNLELMNWLIQLWQVRDCSKELTQTVYDAYEDEGEAALPLLEVLIGKLVSYENFPDRMPGLAENEAQLEIFTQNRHFWSYFFSVAYSFSDDGREEQEGDYHYILSKYIDKVYPSSHRWNKQFCGRERKILLGDKEIRVLFFLHHVEYFLDGEPVFYQTLSFKNLATLSETEEDIINFFLLLPITETDFVSQVKEEVLKRIVRLPFYKPTWNYLAACLANNTDWEQRPDQKQNILEAVMYCENEWHCFKGELTARKFTVEYKTPEGWYSMKLRNGESQEVIAIEKQSKRIGYMRKVLKSFLPPDAQIKKIISVSEKTSLEKAESIFEAILEKSNRFFLRKAQSFLMPETQKFINSRNTNSLLRASIVLWFGKEEEGSVSAMYYMYANDVWMPKHTMLEMQGEEKNAYIKREERLLKRVGEAVDIIGCFRVGDILPFPIGIGRSGIFYTYFHHQLISANSFPELIIQCVDLKDLDRVEIDEGVRVKGKYVKKLECWFDYKHNPKTRNLEYNYPIGSFHELFEEV